MGGEEFEMLHHRMAAMEAEFRDDTRPLGPCRHPGEGHAALHGVALDPFEAPQEIEMPPGAAELAVGDGMHTDLLLFFDDMLDFAILDGFQLRGIDRARRERRARVLQRGGTQQACRHDRRGKAGWCVA